MTPEQTLYALDKIQFALDWLVYLLIAVFGLLLCCIPPLVVFGLNVRHDLARIANDIERIDEELDDEEEEPKP